MKVRTLVCAVILFSLVLFAVNLAKATDPDLAIIINHTCTDITAIPQSAIEQAKASLHIAYGHTSHGSQLITGMDGLIAFANGGGKGLSLPTNIFSWSYNGAPASLDLHDYAMGGDVGYYPDWVNNTISYLGPPDSNTGRGSTHPQTNVIIWSWCGQISGKYSAGTLNSEYLAPMSQLEANYPGVIFVYMTGHLDHSVDAANKAANQMVRDYCQTHNKVLYDFADIESYNPDGTYFQFADDGCNYYASASSGTILGNWATEWQASHTVNVDWFNCSPAHTEALNGNQKAYAAWWLWTWLAGWQGFSCLPQPTNLVADANSFTQQITLTWTDNSHDPNNEDYFIIQRQVDSGSWNNNYDTVSADVTTFTDSSLAYGTYHYRVVAHSSSSCDSTASNIATAVLSSQLPNAPSSLNSSVVGSAVNLTWTDNSSNEATFILERKVDSGSFAVLAGSIPADTINYSDSTVAPLHTYTYRIKAHNSFGDSDYSNETSKYIYGSSTTIKLQTTTEVDDAFLESANPNTNYGATTWSTVTDRYIVKFNFPTEVLNKKITSAKIAFYGWNQSNYHAGEYMDLYRAARNWAESTVTWNIAQTGQSWTAPGGDYAELLGRVPLLQGVDHAFYPVVDITDIVQKWVNGTADNFGLLLINNALTDTGLKASEYSDNARTYLEITYTTGCSCVIDGDIDYDCTVDFLDFAKLAQNWLTENAIGDIAPAPTGDGVVDANDLSTLSDNWLTTCP